MKTVFVCDSLDLRVEGLDNRPYAVNEKITLKHQGRWLPMIVDEIREFDGIRQVYLRLNNSPDAIFLRQKQNRLPEQTEAVTEEWIHSLVEAIEGKRGSVSW